MYALIGSPFLHAAVIPLVICIRHSDVYQPIGRQPRTYINISFYLSHLRVERG